ncbi:hypothetical protein ACFU99_10485 [Streptomyces sp. NPDC057654]|uniref:hypothetical protein n=1 Tax=Streptomyces sp. NPDC057654 TaxID=3346196 RepID=UPI00367C4EE2
MEAIMGGHGSEDGNGTHNSISGGTFHGPVGQFRDVHGNLHMGAGMPEDLAREITAEKRAARKERERLDQERVIQQNAAQRSALAAERQRLEKEHADQQAPGIETCLYGFIFLLMFGMDIAILITFLVNAWWPAFWVLLIASVSIVIGVTIADRGLRADKKKRKERIRELKDWEQRLG